jgi:hypothetical protein
MVRDSTDRGIILGTTMKFMILESSTALDMKTSSVEDG